jgi:hypothetical protein
MKCSTFINGVFPSVVERSATKSGDPMGIRRAAPRGRRFALAYATFVGDGTILGVFVQRLLVLITFISGRTLFMVFFG